MGGFGPFEGGCRTHCWLEVPFPWPQQCWVGISSAGGSIPSADTEPGSTQPDWLWRQTECTGRLLHGASTASAVPMGQRSFSGPLQSSTLGANNSMAFINCLRITCNMQLTNEKKFCRKGLYLATSRFWHRDKAPETCGAWGRC